MADMPSCTDLSTRPWVVEAGVRVVDAPFHARGPVATAGGCLASQYLAAWMMAKRAGIEATTQALHYAGVVAHILVKREEVIVVSIFTADGGTEFTGR